HSIHDPRMYAAASFGDPRYLVSMSRRTLAASGIDVLAHCTESYLSRKANALSRAYAAAGIRQLVPALSKALDTDDPDAGTLEALYEASLLGGLAIGVTGTVFPHNVGYYLTERFGLEHGFACAVFLPALLQHVHADAPDLYSRFVDETGCSEANLNALCAQALPELNIRLTDAEIESALPRWQNNKSVLNTASTVTVEHISAVLHQLFTQS
ncbi:MAG: iron-containing alcohol dehydrogenase, partial [Clostridia bacterium]|nr:iron-containing alcohol dehydrogenase [Clostridia bacterium]